MEMIRVENFHKSYGDLRAVDGVSFSVESGELFGFLGPNGAGKTTTLSMISGLLRPDQGRISLQDIDVWQDPIPAKRLMGVVPQDLALYEELTARENMMFWGGLYHLPKATLVANVDFWLEQVGLKDRAAEPVAKFSGGMKRRLNLAIGLVHRPKVLLLDEPTVGIDPQGRNTVLELIRTVSRQGTTILFTTHHLEEAESLCDRVAIMDHGKILQTGSVSELARAVGDGDLVTLQGSFGGAELKTLLEHEKLTVLNLTEKLARLMLHHEGIKTAGLLQKLADARIDITDVSLQKPSLESVFLKLTGRGLRD